MKTIGKNLDKRKRKYPDGGEAWEDEDGVTILKPAGKMIFKVGNIIYEMDRQKPAKPEIFGSFGGGWGVNRKRLRQYFGWVIFSNLIMIGVL